jgi:aryl-alcohol dehydrogenase-like predicted oxidoreductase
MEYSLVACTSKGAHLPKCGSQGIAAMPWSPAQNGRLTGKHRCRFRLNTDPAVPVEK